jgi:hypothetical protein
LAHTPHNLELRPGPRRVAIPAFARSISARISTLAQKPRSGALAGNSEAFRDLFLRFGRILPAEQPPQITALTSHMLSITLK